MSPFTNPPQPLTPGEFLSYLEEIQPVNLK